VAGWRINAVLLSNEIPACSSPMNASSSSASRGSAASVGYQERCGQEKSRSRTGREFGRHRSQRRRSRLRRDRCVTGSFAYAGQSCISVQRILVEHSATENSPSCFWRKFRKLKAGDPLDEASDLGRSSAKATPSVPLTGYKKRCAAVRAALWRQPQRLFVRAHRTYGHQAHDEGELRGNFCAGCDRRALQRFRLRAETRSTVPHTDYSRTFTRDAKLIFRPMTNSKSEV